MPILLPATPTSDLYRAVLTAPNRTWEQHRRAWQPLLPQLVRYVSEKQPGEILEGSLPSEGALGVTVSGTWIEDGRQAAVLVAKVSDARMKRTRHALVVVSDGAAQAITEFLPQETPSLSQMSAAVTDGYLRLGGSASKDGAATALVLHRKGGSWQRLARRMSHSRGVARPHPEDLSAFDVRLRLPQGNYVRPASGAPGLEGLEKWNLRRATLTCDGMQPIRNEAWTIDSLITALRSDDPKAAYDFVADPQIVKQARSAGLGAAIDTWELHRDDIGLVLRSVGGHTQFGRVRVSFATIKRQLRVASVARND